MTLDLFTAPNPGSALERDFADFHAANPHIADDLERRAAALIRAGVRRIGIALLYESARYDHAIRTNGDPWKLNNNHKAFYARLLLQRHPEWTGIIETRRSHADAVAA
jgi:hypothetical protein